MKNSTLQENEAQLMLATSQTIRDISVIYKKTLAEAVEIYMGSSCRTGEFFKCVLALAKNRKKCPSSLLEYHRAYIRALELKAALK